MVQSINRKFPVKIYCIIILTLYSMLNSPESQKSAFSMEVAIESIGILTLALGWATQLIRVPKHIIQRDFSHTSEFFITTFTIYDGTASCINPTNNLIWKSDRHQPKLGAKNNYKGLLWNSDGATTSTVMIGSSMTGLACLKASRKAPIAANLKANSEESTTWNAPSCNTRRQPEIEFPDNVPFSKASKNPYKRKFSPRGL